MYNSIIAYGKRLREELASLDAEIRKAPKGNFVATKNGGSSKWYVTINGKREYVPKDRRRYAASLAKKKYAMARRSCLKKEIRAVDYYIKHHSDSWVVDNKYLGSSSVYRELLEDKYYLLDNELKAWMASDYEKSDKYTDNLVTENDSSLSYRSKSEAIIEMALISAGIPYRYESMLEINGIKFFPDFTIRKTTNGKVVYWEHLGLMDEEKYVAMVGSKLSLYADAGIYLGDNLFITYETKSNPLRIDDVNRIIEKIKIE